MSDYQPEQVWLSCSEGILSWDDSFHSLMLNDQLRMEAYSTAISEVIKPGMVVLDLGTGTGILALWALQSGAARVYGIDVSAEVLRKAIERLSTAGYADRFKGINALSYEVELPERVDLIISEIMGNIGDNEDFVPILSDARKRFLKPGGQMLPYHVESYLVPVGAERAHAQLREGVCHGLAASTTLNEALARNGIQGRFNCYYDVILPQSSYLATPRVLRRFALDGTDAPTYELSLIFPLSRSGVLTGFKGYFLANLSSTVALDISGDDIPGRTTSDSWKHCYLPIETPIRVTRGDRVVLTFIRSYPKNKDNPFRHAYRWQGEVLRGDRVIGRFSQSMRPGS